MTMDKEKIELSYLRKKAEVLEHEKEELTEKLKTAEAEKDATDVRSANAFQAIKNLEYERNRAQSERLEAETRAKKAQGDYEELRFKYLSATASNEVGAVFLIICGIILLGVAVTLQCLYAFLERNNTFLWTALACALASMPSWVMAVLLWNKNYYK